jgi:hypothetical protein
MKEQKQKDTSKEDTVELQRIEIEKLIEDFFRPRKEEQK